MQVSQACSWIFLLIPPFAEIRKVIGWGMELTIVSVVEPSDVGPMSSTGGADVVWSWVLLTALKEAGDRLPSATKIRQMTSAMGRV